MQLERTKMTKLKIPAFLNEIWLILISWQSSEFGEKCDRKQISDSLSSEKLNKCITNRVKQSGIWRGKKTIFFFVSLLFCKRKRIICIVLRIYQTALSGDKKDLSPEVVLLVEKTKLESDPHTELWPAASGRLSWNMDKCFVSDNVLFHLFCSWSTGLFKLKSYLKLFVWRSNVFGSIHIGSWKID